MTDQDTSRGRLVVEILLLVVVIGAFLSWLRG